MAETSARVVALCGGVGGAKLALGLAQVVPGEELLIAVNTGDDFTHLGLAISPDLDTVLYTLAGIADPERGWGLAGESWAFMDQLAALGAEDWFALGDRDLATHVWRSARLAMGESLSAITARMARKLGVEPFVLPMSGDLVRTMVDTDEWELPFQDYFVRRQCQPVVRGIRYQGAEAARPAPALLAALANPALEAVVICPSNPWLSVAPLLAMPKLRETLAKCRAPIIAVSPIIGHAAVKGPTAKIMRELGLEVSALEVARHYGALLDGFVLDSGDAAQAAAVAALGMVPALAPTLMTDLASKRALAAHVLDLAARLRQSPPSQESPRERG